MVNYRERFVMNTYANEIPATIYADAHAQGVKAGNACNPTPMIVGTPTTPLGNDIDYEKDVHYVSDGPCGFAWVNIKPARGKFVKFLKDNNIGRKDSYYGGYTIWVSGFGQSLDRKTAYAQAFAGVLKENGLTAYSMSRMD